MASRIKPHPEAFTRDGGAGIRQRRSRFSSEAHLAFVRSLPCLVTGREVTVEAAHIRYADERYAKRNTGLGERPSDMWVVPLVAAKHRLARDAQHNQNERAFWEATGIDPLFVASLLFIHSGNEEAARQVIRKARLGARS